MKLMSSGANLSIRKRKTVISTEVFNVVYPLWQLEIGILSVVYAFKRPILCHG